MVAQSSGNNSATEPIMSFSSHPPVPMTALVFLNNILASTEVFSNPKNLIDILPSPITLSTAIDPRVNQLARIIADYSAILQARQHHAVLLADDRPFLAPLPQIIRFPAVHRTVSENFISKLNATMSACARALSTHLIEAKELALGKIIFTQIEDILAVWTPSQDQIQAIIEYKNIRLRCLTVHKQDGSLLDFYQPLGSRNCSPPRPAQPVTPIFVNGASQAKTMDTPVLNKRPTRKSSRKKTVPPQPVNKHPVTGTRPGSRPMNQPSTGTRPPEAITEIFRLIVDDDIRLTFVIGGKSIEALDLTLSIDPDGSISSKLYKKPMEARDTADHTWK
ncbi:hypothetical protein OUZ56_032144 [Daphnia magna]|uniref:Uncharacterized protein n=1 Tax=Daphnia magna TaxID=35525 RepID=A0ABQ9ZW96_9CRUS|nr:hypothetical protein OUZ56_032144 [Daphnia magna]